MAEEKVMSVLSYEKRDRVCPTCKKAGILYVCHGFGLPWSEMKKIQEMCRPCAEAAAGGEEKIHVKTTWPKLRQVWSSGKRPPAPACWKAGIEARKQKQK